MKIWRLPYLLIVLAIPIAGCSAEPAEGPGQCKLSCSNAIIGTSDYKIEPFTEDLTLRCLEVGKKETRTLTGQFRITKKRATATGVEEVSVPNISIRPVLNGLYNPEENGSGIPGIVTSESNFCSDACGLVTIDFSVACPDQGDGEVTLSVNSGGLRSTKAMRVQVQAATFVEIDYDDLFDRYRPNNNSGNN